MIAVTRPERAVLRLARPYLGRLLGAGLLAAVTEFAGLALMATATWLLMSAAGRPPLDRLTVAIVAVRALAVSRGVFRYTERLAGHDAVLRLVTDVRARVFAALAARRAPEQRTGDALSRLVSDVEAVQDLLLRVLVPASAAALVSVVAVGAAALIDPAAAGALAVGLLVAGVALPALATALTRRAAAEVAPLRGALAADAVDLTHGAADLAAFGATASALAAAGRRTARLARLERRLAATGFAVDAAGVLVAGLTAAAVVFVALARDVDGVLVGVLAVGALAAVEVALALVGAARQRTQLSAGLTRVAALLDAAPTDTAPTEAEPVEAGAAPARVGAGPGGETAPATVSVAAPHDVRFTDLTVRYRAGAAPALVGFDLDLPAGRRVAVVGPSGAGKSTIAAVLTGSVRPEAGRVTLDGRDLSAYSERELPRAVGGLLAEAYVFHASVRDNLLLGRAGASDDELAAATAAAGLLDWVREQPDGWDTVVGEEGGQLSGGQRQRLALARALLAAPGVLVLDEPTEGLDPAAADAVLAATLAATPPGHSVLLISHRLSGLAGLDEVVVLDAGRVVQRGRHADLVAAPGWYRDQWRLQEAAERGYFALTP
ncbi:thiol reductant ABC exporter subunit CydC [Micromonospora echinaurantiaca]|uniref:thiol reductant ABC exporter subunit CydC n=1 Tax=Micromonospora echinaurantiaca TaxID=47857 RepID=UPI003442B76F